MKKIHPKDKLRFALLAALAVAVVFGALAYAYPENSALMAVARLSSVGTSGLFVGWMMRKGKENQWLNRVAETLRRLKNWIVGKAVYAVRMLGFSRSAKGGGTDVTEFVFHTEQGKKSASRRRLRLPRWKDLTDERARIRYLYAAFWLGKRGQDLPPAEATPTELLPDAEKKAPDYPVRTLFTSYEKARYGTVVPEKQENEALFEALRKS